MRGSLNLGMRMEWGTAMLASLYANAHRAQHAPPRELYEFAPHHDQPELTLEQAMANWA